MADLSPTAEASPLPAAQALPSRAVSRGKRRAVFSTAAQAVSVATLAIGYWVLLAGEALVSGRGVAPERALALSGAAAAGVVLVGSFTAAALARRITVLEQAVAWLLVNGVAIPFLYLAMMEPGLDRFAPPDLLYLSTLLGNPLSGLVLAAHAMFLVQLLGATLGYLAAGGGTLDLRFTFEAHIARQHLRLSPAKVIAVFAVGIISPALLLLWPFTLIALTLVDAFASSGTRRRVLEQLMPYIAILGVSIGVCALVTVLSVMSGFELDLKKKILGTNAHAVVLKYGTDFTEYRDVAEKVRHVRGVKGVSPFVLNEVMLTSEQNLAGVLIKGIDPATVGQVTDLPANITQGGSGKLEYLARPNEIPASTAPGADMRDVLKEIDDAASKAHGDSAGGPSHPAPAKAEPAAKPAGPVLPGIVLGRELARSLKVYLGDRVNVVSPLGGELGPQGPMPKSRPFRVAAIFYSGMYEYDSKFAYIGLDAAQKFFNLGDTVNGLELKVDDIDNTRVINRKILEVLDGYPYRTKDWGEMNRNLFSALRLEKLAMAIMLTFIVLVACINILSTLIVFALQKAKEVAILKSMGARDTGIMKIFVLEGLIIGVIGTVLGLLQGYGCCLFVEKFGIRLDPEVYYINKLPVRIEGAQFAVVALVALLLSYLATVFPALNAGRLRPVEGLKTE